MTVRPPRASTLALAVIASAASSLGAAEPPPPPQGPWIAHIFPAGGRRGETVEVAVGGLHLREAHAVRIAGGGVEGRILDAANDTSARIRLTTAADAALGERDVRIVTPRGISNRFRFLVDELPEVIEAEPNSRREDAQRIGTLPVVVNGRLLQADDDLYRFPAKAGETIVCEVHARSILPYIADAVPGWAQAVLTLVDASGREIAYVDDFRFSPDPLLIHRVERDGEYTIGIHDALYRGREDFVYRLRLGPLPRVTHIFPLGAKRGSAARVELAGANLPQEAVSLEVPADAPPILPMSIVSGGLSSNFLPFAAGDMEEVTEMEPNDAPAQAHRLSVPVTVNGRIGCPGDVDVFSFGVEVGERLVMEVRARRLGSPLDSILTLLDARGRSIARDDDTVDEAEGLITHHADSRVAFAFPSKGEYWLRLGDAQGKGGDEYAYRLTVAGPRPDFAVRVSPDTIRIAPAGTAALTAQVIRKDGLSGAIRISARDLPRGFALRGATIPAGEATTRFTITAPRDLAAALYFPAFEATAAVSGNEVVREALPVEEVVQAFSTRHRVPTREMLLAVVEPPPFTLSAILPHDDTVEIPLGAEVALAVKAVRGARGTGPIRLAADAPVKGLALKGAAIPPGKDEATLTLTTGKQAVVGLTQNLVIAGTMRAGREAFVQVCPAVPFRIVAAPTPADTGTVGPTPEGAAAVGASSAEPPTPPR